jgi:alkylhydroperoxidase family enzyme
VAEEQGIDQRKLEATWDIEDPIFTQRERAALEMASLFTEDYRAISDEHVQRWRTHFSDEELLELGAFMAFADGFGKLVEMLGLGQQDQACAYEV